mmetsp:Transcript_36851/g.60685  ORF Transcript_36851/g.60685 Transcript_36851/m.60685 type:complete len:207 (-) Transcript_36851:191-811(-)
MKNFKIIAAFKRFIAKEMNFFKLFLLHKAQTIRLIPAVREHIVRDLTSNRALEFFSQFWQLLLERFDHFLAHFVLLIKLKVLNALFLTAIAPDWRHIDHTTSKLHKSAALFGQLQTRNIHHAKVHKLRNLVLAQFLLEIVRVQCLAILPRAQAILTEHEIKKVTHIACFGAAQLFLLFGEVRATNKTQIDLGFCRLQQFPHRRFDH